MSIELRVIVDQLAAEVPGGIGRYTEELTRQLVETAPDGCTVAGVVSRVSADDRDRITTLLPGLSSLITLDLPRRELAAAWRLGIPVPGRDADGDRRPMFGMTHATSALSPLFPHDRARDAGNQTVATIHDVVPWTHPETLTRNGVAFHKTMAKRAHRYADAVVVPTHAVARELNEIMNFGDRIRVIGGAVSPKLAIPVDADVRAERLNLPERYILAVGTLEPRKRLKELIRSLAHPESVDLPLLIAGPEGWGGIDVAAVATEAGLSPDRVRTLGFVADADLAVVIERATVFVMPSIAEGFGLPIVEAFSLGTPVVHSDAAALVEVAGGAGLAVPTADEDGYPERLAEAISSVVNDDETLQRMRFLGLDRARAFSWEASARQVWQLHADL